MPQREAVAPTATNAARRPAWAVGVLLVVSLVLASGLVG
jgi:hypothetical protein